MGSFFGRVVIRLWMMPTFSTLSSVQQNILFFLPIGMSRRARIGGVTVTQQSTGNIRFEYFFNMCAPANGTVGKCHLVAIAMQDAE